MTQNAGWQAMFEKTQEIIEEQLHVSIDKLAPSAHFVDDLGADSLDIVELVMAFEERFAIEIPDEDSQNLVTVRSAVDYLISKGAKL